MTSSQEKDRQIWGEKGGREGKAGEREGWTKRERCRLQQQAAVWSVLSVQAESWSLRS